jgi:hypothetical protein
MYTRNWKDQPAVLEKGEKILSIFMKDCIEAVQIKEGPDAGFFVTVGNLFGSQTIKVTSANDVIAMLQMVYDRQSGAKSRDIPDGWKVIPQEYEGAIT